MKKLQMLLVIFQIFNASYSQDYQCIRTGSEYFFTDDDHFQAIRIDSVVSQNGNQVYYNFPAMGETIEPWCLTEKGPSWMGRKMIATPAGENIFFNLENDAITIKTLASTGQYWNCYVFPSGNHIQATVESIDYESFLGLYDSVKTISFQATDPQGNPVSHPINEMSLKLSKNYGLIKTVNFRVFPDLSESWHQDYCNQYDLCGISEPATGIQNLIAAEVFDYETGDEIHTYEHFYSWIGTPHEINAWMIFNVLNKEVSANELIYTIKRCGKRETIQGIPPNGWDTTFFYNDTISESYTFEYLNQNIDLNSLPEHVVAAGDSSFTEYHWYNQSINTTLNRRQKIEANGFVSSWPDTCIYPIITDEKYYENNCYIEGLGGPYWNLSDMGWETNHNPVYYKKGTEVWGTPLNCDSLLVGIIEKVAVKQGVTILPNPMLDWAKFSINQQSGNRFILKLFDSTGRPSGEWQFNSPDFIFSRGNLKPGVYFYMITGDNNFTIHGKIVLL